MASTTDRLKKDLAEAMRAKDEHAKTTIRMMMGAIRNEQVAGEQARELSDAEELAVITKEMRKRREAATTYYEAGREDLAEKETAEAEFMTRYLPAPLTDAELETIVTEEVGKVRATGEEPSMKHMGAIVKAVNARAEGRADGGVVAQRVRAQLGA